jgi:hypothetical protein
MQSSVTLSQKDIERFNKAVTRLATIGAALLQSATHNGQPNGRRRRRRRKAVEPELAEKGIPPAKVRRRRRVTLPDPPEVA